MLWLDVVGTGTGVGVGTGTGTGNGTSTSTGNGLGIGIGIGINVIRVVVVAYGCLRRFLMRVYAHITPHAKPELNRLKQPCTEAWACACPDGSQPIPTLSWTAGTPSPC